MMIKGRKFENTVAEALKSRGFGVVQNVYPFLPYDSVNRNNCWEGQAQIDVIAFDFNTNSIFVVECKDWLIQQWMDYNINATNWVYIVREYNYNYRGKERRKLVKKEAFNPLFQIYWEKGMLSRSIKGNEENQYYTFNMLVVFRENAPWVSGCINFSKDFPLLGTSSKLDIKRLYEFLKTQEDFSYDTFKNHKENLDNDRRNRRGAYRLDWNNTKSFAMDKRYLGQYSYLL